jgi:hypothetical protein
MASHRYEVYVFCDECAEPHPMPIAIQLEGLRESRYNDITDGVELPERLAYLRSNQVQCPKTGRMYTQEDNRQVFLVRAD